MRKGLGPRKRGEGEKGKSRRGKINDRMQKGKGNGRWASLVVVNIYFSVCGMEMDGWLGVCRWKEEAGNYPGLGKKMSRSAGDKYRSLSQITLARFKCEF